MTSPEQRPAAGTDGAVTDRDAATDLDQPPPGEPDPALAQLEDRWRRTAADLDNLRKRYARDLDRERLAERAKVAAAWLPVLDNLDLALAHAGTDAQSVVQGVQAIRDQAVHLLEQLGYPRYAETGVPFSPTLHEVVSVADAPDVPPGTVLEVIRPGYGDNGHQLRPASVVVSRREG
ncbi:nucleotide exchange factor GrpE [Nocardia alni]|uniref:nucleotide exchange factor GrpE n=1 Tax=Nocardia alni TaxID=2815723 RepID=UPI001C211CD7|nr:nucleotide exchange factor GrpE [Nocardia alni]